MAKKTKEELLVEAEGLGVSIPEDAGYSEVLDAVKRAREGEVAVHAAHELSEPSEEDLVEKPFDVATLPASERITSPPGSSRRRFPFDSLGRYVGR